MKRQLKTALGVGGIVVATALIGLVVFLYLGSDIGVYVIGVGVPVVVLATIGLYVRGVITRDKVEQGDFLQEAARNVAERFRDELTTLNRLTAAYPEWEPESVQVEARHLADDFEDAGVDVDVETASFTVRAPERVQAFDRLENEVDTFAAERDRAFVEFAEREVERARQGARTVRASILDDEEPADVTTADDLPEGPDVEAAEQVLSSVREEAESAYSAAVERIEATVDEYDGNADRVESHLADARRAIDVHDWDAAAEALTDAQRAAESEVSEAFSADREAVVQLLSTVESTDIERYAEDEDLATFEEARTRLDEIDSALASDELDALGAEVRAAAEGVVETLETELDNDVETIREADVPMGFYTAPPAVATDYHDRVTDIDDLETFRTEWLSAVGELLDAVETAETKASVADSYGMVEERIEEGLRSDGRVDADELPVRDAAPFLELYAENHPETTYDASIPAVSVEGSGETYDVTVTARLATSTGEEHDLTVELSGPGIEKTTTDNTFVATEHTFESVPYGEYTVRAHTSAERFAEAETTRRVTGDESLELVLSEVTLRERVCGDEEGNIRDQLPTVAPELSEAFASKEFLTSDSDIPVADEYVPCLLVLWAEQEDHETRMDDGRVLVYDHEQFRSRLEMITTHNLTDDDIMTYDDMRQKFLSVPASDELIISTLRELDIDVTVDETEVRG